MASFFLVRGLGSKFRFRDLEVGSVFSNECWILCGVKGLIWIRPFRLSLSFNDSVYVSWPKRFSEEPQVMAN